MTTTVEAQRSERRRSPDRPAVDPRLQRRWIEARRREGRRRLKFLVAAVAVVVVVVGALGIVHTPLFRVRHVKVLGVASAARLEIVTAAGLDKQRLMIDLDPSSTARKIERISWVKTAEVVEQWPSTVRMTVTSRTAVGEVWRSPRDHSRGVALVDSTGRVLADAPTPDALPMLGSQSPPGAPGTWLPNSPGALGPDPTAEEVVVTAGAAPPTVAKRITSIVVANGQLLLLVGHTTVVFGDGSEVTHKMMSLQTLLDQVDFSGVARVDLRVPDRPALTTIVPPTSVSTTSGG